MQKSPAALAKEIQRRRSAEKKLEAFKVVCRRLYDNASDGICVINKDNQVPRFNRTLQEMMARMGFEIRKGNCAAVFEHDLCGTDRCLMARIFEEDEERIEEEIEVGTAQGARRRLSSVSSPCWTLPPKRPVSWPITRISPIVN